MKLLIWITSWAVILAIGLVMSDSWEPTIEYSVIPVENITANCTEGWVMYGNLTSTPLDPYESLRKAYSKLWVDFQILQEANEILREDNLNLRVALSHWNPDIWNKSGGDNLTILLYPVDKQNEEE